MTPVRHFAFLEFEHIADAESALSLSGVVFRGNVLILSRSNCITKDDQVSDCDFTGCLTLQARREMHTSCRCACTSWLNPN